ncbi:response regulator [Longitalea luteola]|uniref:response regulator n=1 Tax=Longitalea luteola TaxID=2812563 RepID=UPI001A95DD56|nr:response regulator [Longitalea luteola]
MKKFPSGPILIVEDDEDDRFFITNAIRKCGIQNELKYFDNGQQALDYLMDTSDKPFIILCDINMPVMDGIELGRKINGNDYLRKKSIPFIFLTTTDNPRHIEDAYKFTVQGFFKKPDDCQQLQEIIQQIFGYWTRCLYPEK